MAKFLLGKKIGMTQIFSEDGSVFPVTVIQAGPSTVTQVLSEDKNGYNAVQVGFGVKKLNKPEAGHQKKEDRLSPRSCKEIWGCSLSSQNKPLNN